MTLMFEYREGERKEGPECEKLVCREWDSATGTALWRIRIKDNHTRTRVGRGNRGTSGRRNTFYKYVQVV